MKSSRFVISKLGHPEYTHHQLLEEKLRTSPPNAKRYRLLARFHLRPEQFEEAEHSIEQSCTKQKVSWMTKLLKGEEPEHHQTEVVEARKRYNSINHNQLVRSTTQQKGLKLLQDHLEMVKEAHPTSSQQGKCRKPLRQLKPSNWVNQTSCNFLSRNNLLRSRDTLNSTNMSECIYGTGRSVVRRRREFCPPSLDPYYDLMNQRNLHYNIERIVEHYKSLLSIGYTEKKLTQLVARFCRDKEELRKTMMQCGKCDELTDKISYEVSKDVDFIQNQFKNIGFVKSQQAFEHFLNEVLLYGEKIEQTVIDDRRRKILFIEKSIRQHHNSKEISKLRELYSMEQAHCKSGYHKMKGMSNTLIDLQRKFGDLNRISDYNIKVHECLTGAEERIKHMSYNTRVVDGENVQH